MSWAVVGELVVSVLAFKSDDQSLNPADVFSKILFEKNKKRPRLALFYLVT